MSMEQKFLSKPFVKWGQKDFGHIQKFSSKVKILLALMLLQIDITPPCYRSFSTFRIVWWSLHANFLFMDISYDRIFSAISYFLAIHTTISTISNMVSISGMKNDLNNSAVLSNHTKKIVILKTYLGK